MNELDFEMPVLVSAPQQSKKMKVSKVAKLRSELKIDAPKMHNTEYASVSTRKFQTISYDKTLLDQPRHEGQKPMLSRLKMKQMLIDHSIAPKTYSQY